MTERKRSNGSKTFVWGVMGFLILGMGGFGLSGAFLNSGGSSVASVGDKDVTVDLFFSALQQDVAQASQNFGFPMTLAQAQSFGLDRVTLRRLLSIAAIDNESDNLNLSVGDDAVAAELLQSPAFQGLSGNFDPVAYDYALRQIGMNREEYDNVVRGALTQTLLRDGLAGQTGNNATAVNTIMGYIGESRNYEWVLIEADSLPTPAAQPTQAELRSFHQANPELFTLPETRQITYVALTPEMLMTGIEVSEEDILAEFAARSSQYNIDASIIVDRIAFGTMSEAQAAKDLIDADSSSFDIVAVNRGVDPAELSLGSLTENQVSPDARAILFAATEPGVYGPVNSNVGPALFRINTMRAAKSTPLDEVRDDIRNAIALNAAGTKIVSLYETIDDFIAGGVSLEDVAVASDMQLFTIAFPASNAEPITTEPAFITEAQEAEIGESRNIIETQDGGIFVLRVDAITPPSLQPLAKTRDIAIQGRMAERTQELVLEYAETLQGLINSGADFSATLSANGMRPGAVVGVTRNAPLGDTPPTVAQAIFELEPGEMTIVDAATGAYLLRLTDIAPFDPSADDSAALMAQIEGQISSSVETDIFAYYTTAVISETGFSVNQPLIDALIIQNTGR